MLVAGNSYAANQGGLVYKAFKPYARQFNIFSVSTCEMFPPNCNRISFNFTQIIEELNPAVVFMIDRSFSLKVSLNVTEPIENDKVFSYYLKTLKFLEKSTKKISLQYLKKGKALRTIKDALVRRDEFFARHRIRELCKRCRKCEIVDYMPVLVDKKGQYLGYDPETNLMYLDHENHFNRFGKQRLQIVFDKLAEEFALFMNK
ncbi:unnamed protein product [Cylicocyclus nassatus]|uniref:SGNH domain-containing protein n=1 Tax=Cylicocyclus nassatus TaxID=53992 RepID=A0AA36GFL7_CYLNA|nr:unnamed protein product [Cylicocyclus nassatus]